MLTVKSHDGTRIAFDRRGSGPTLILVDGALCSRSFGPMPKLAVELAPHFTVINYDRRGRGGSTDTKPYAVAREVEDLEALIAEGGGSAYVAGLSSGAALALEAAARGLPIRGLALHEPPFVAEHGKVGEAGNFAAHLNELIRADRRGDAVKYFMKDMVNVPAVFVFMMRLMPMWSQLKAVAHTLPYDAAVLGDFTTPTQRAAAVRVPTVVMYGEKTPPRLQRAAKETAAAIPNATHRVLKGQTHNIAAKVLAPEMAGFFLGSDSTQRVASAAR